MTESTISTKIGRTLVGDTAPPRIMGVLNVSQESFFKDSYVIPQEIASRATAMIHNGADFLDIGARSTAPRSPHIAIEEEHARLCLALETLFNSVDTDERPISIDTQYRSVASSAYRIFEKYGNEHNFVLNDVSCLTADSDLAHWICDVDKPVIIMAAHNKPGDSLGIENTITDLSIGIGKLDRYGMKTQQRVVIDPAIGRWIPEKTARYDLSILKSLQNLRSFGMPILVGISRKSFIAEILDGRQPSERLYGTLAATAIAVYNGAHIIRTHDVTTETLDVVKTAYAVRREGAGLS